ncbi:MAG TPA: GNAT family N-acetyltransferase, partial [Pseudonocardiaceae bacterium]|nr:GNAT family N-acetyltransferase [Pseudonocardiaceae bacterium]
MKITVIRPGELGEPELARWRGFQRDCPALANPFLSPEFTVAVGRHRPRTRVAVLSDGPDLVGFFPFERRRFGYGVPVAAGLTHCQGLVHAPDLEWDPQELLRACGLAVWEFDNLVDGQKPFEPYQVLREPSPIMDLSGGYEAYLTHLRRSFVRDLQRKQRRLERDVGELRFVFGARDGAAFRALLGWKSAQYRRTGRPDRLADPWVARLLAELIETCSDGFSGVLAVLYAGGEPIAGHFLLRMDGVLAGWFPAYDPRFSSFSPGLVTRLRMAEAAAAAGVQQIDMARGPMAYKESFKSKDIFVAEGRITRRSPVGVLHWSRSPVRR